MKKKIFLYKKKPLLKPKYLLYKKYKINLL